MDNHSSDISVSTLEQAIEEARANEQWVERNFVQVVTWLAENTDNIPDASSLASSSALELNLVISRPSAVALGDSVEMSCTLEASRTIVGETCRFVMEESVRHFCYTLVRT